MSILALLLLVLAPFPQETALPDAVAVRAPAPDAPLAEHEVARVDGASIPWTEFRRYVGTVYARRPEGDEALRREVVRQRAASRAAALGISVTPADVDRLADALLARAAGADEAARAELAEQLARPELRASLTDLALQQKLVRHDDDLAVDAPVSDERVQQALDALHAAADVQEQPLDHVLAATWEGGELSREALGAGVLELLSEEDRQGVLTELIGIALVHGKARALGVRFTAEAAAAELVDRQAYVARNPTSQGLSYDDILAKVEMRSREELVASPAFIAQVLLRSLVETTWDEDRVRALYEAERAEFDRRYGADAPWDVVRHGVWRTVRQRTYQQLFAECTILRRF